MKNAENFSRAHACGDAHASVMHDNDVKRTNRAGSGYGFPSGIEDTFAKPILFAERLSHSTKATLVFPDNDPHCAPCRALHPPRGWVN